MGGTRAPLLKLVLVLSLRDFTLKFGVQLLRVEFLDLACDQHEDALLLGVGFEKRSHGF